MAEPLTKEEILDAAEQVFRRFGLEKTSVVDVARLLNVSHGTLYRHYASKAELREAVAGRWLKSVSVPLSKIINEELSPVDKVKKWLNALITVKKTKAAEDPELFAVYSALAEDSVEIIKSHIHDLITQLEKIIEEGMKHKDVNTDNPHSLAAAIFYATARFHHPALSKEWSSPDIDKEFQLVWGLIQSGLKN
ncbi:TetR family transcriptional regulator [Fictibacillus aquaticus]|uniref:TetR family transcriptional regulator n=1 Tax=Fictibacillus aquaticus TaxID=2021314 RepID=A0A235FD94_9BACL|nr:TetR family transcriptional regulator [Fictibacillus aquaticus]OYD58765.1 TetR family transcriptional regulator [Fictibacillus aquaticus]